MGTGTAAGHRYAGGGISSGASAQKHSENSRCRSLKCKAYKPVATYFYPHTHSKAISDCSPPPSLVMWHEDDPSTRVTLSHYSLIGFQANRGKKASLCGPGIYTCDNLPMDHNENQQLSINNHFLRVRTDGSLHVTALKLSMALQMNTQFERNH